MTSEKAIGGSWRSLIGALAVSLGAASATPPVAAQKAATKDASPPAYILHEADQRIARALDARQSFSFDEATLTEFVEGVRDQLSIPVLIDEVALHDDGISTDSPITIDVKNVSARSALRLALRPLGLTQTIRSGILRITTPDAAEQNLVPRVYPATDLVEPDADHDLDWLVQVCTSIVAPQSWSDVGGPGSISAVGRSLVVSHTAGHHHRLAALLTNLRRFAREPKLLSLALDDSPARRRLEAALEQPAKLEFDVTPLSDVLSVLSETHQAPMILDARSLAAFGLDGDEPVTIQLRDVPLHVALDAMLRPLELTALIRDEVIQVTTLEESERSQTARIYALRGLRHLDLDNVIETLTTMVEPDSWEEVGGPASIGVAQIRPPGLIVSQSDRAHRQIARLMSDLRAAAPTKEEQAALAAKRAQATAMVVYSFEQSPLEPQEAMGLIKVSIPNNGLEEEGAFAIATKALLIVRHREPMQQQIRQLLGRFGVFSQQSGMGGMGGMGGGFGGGGGGMFKVAPDQGSSLNRR